MLRRVAPVSKRVEISYCRRPTPNHPSYPGAHGCLSTAEADILGYLFPRNAAALAALAEEARESCVWAGIHYRRDIVARATLGHAVAGKVIDRAKKDGAPTQYQTRSAI
jgi:hypothetical protein